MQASGNVRGVYDQFRVTRTKTSPSTPRTRPTETAGVSAHVVSQTGGDVGTQSGVMIRSGVDPQAAYLNLITPTNNVVVKWRSTFAGNTSTTQLPAARALRCGSYASRYTDPATHTVSYSRVHIVRWGELRLRPRFADHTLNLPQPLVAGIATDANRANLVATVTFTNVAQLAGSQPPPLTCPAAWSCITDVGGALPPGQDQLADTGTWNEFTGGSDIWAQTDSFPLRVEDLARRRHRRHARDGATSDEPLGQGGPDDSARPPLPDRRTTGAVRDAEQRGSRCMRQATQDGTSSQILRPRNRTDDVSHGGSYTTSGSSCAGLYTAYTSPDGDT